MVFIGSGGLKDVLFIKIKYRHDGFTDQFSRIFMTKMFIISAFIMSIDFFSDRVSCMVEPERMSEEFVHSACWIQGFFIYEELRSVNWFRSQSGHYGHYGYYGMPKVVNHNGLNKQGHLCSTKDIGTQRVVVDCKPLTKTYYVQYQYLSFYIASLAVIYYVPYLMFRFLNADMISLKTNVKKDEVDKSNVNKITSNYFNYESNGGVWMLRLKILANLGIKVVYAIVNVGGFLFTDNLLHNNYIDYGVKWIQWATREPQKDGKWEHDIIENVYPKPGNVLLPTMGFCEVTEGASSRTSQHINDYTFICEISTHVLYQYVLLVLWFLFIIGIIVSFMGVVLHMGINIFASLSCAMMRRQKKCAFYSACKKLTLREIEYMKYIRMNNLPLYNAILRNLLNDSGV